MEQMLYPKYSGNDRVFRIPDSLNGKEIYGIAGKAFLSCKTIECLYVSQNVSLIQEWAFAHMKNLTEIHLPCRDITFGKNVFLGCDHLEKIQIYQVDDREQEKAEREEAFAYLLASVFRFFPREKLMDLQYAGDPIRRSSWLSEYDKALDEYLSESDEEGFVPAFIGWFDVEDVDQQMEKHTLRRRQQKIILLLRRLFQFSDLQTEYEKGWKSYLLMHKEMVLEMAKNADFPFDQAQTIAFMLGLELEERDEGGQTVDFFEDLRI